MDVRRSGGDGWEAVDEHGEVAGRAEVWTRPDERAFLVLDDASTGPARIALLELAPADVDGALHFWVRDEATRERAALEGQGFEELRREDHLEIAPDDALDWLRANPGPDVALVGVDDLDVDRLRSLDEELRGDVPGCDGWRWVPDVFRAEMHSAGHDDRLARVAVEDGDPVGLVRVWIDRDAPRIGLVGVRRDQRGRGLARSLLADVFEELGTRQEPVVVTEADPTNIPVRRLFDALGGTVVRTYVDMVRPA